MSTIHFFLNQNFNHISSVKTLHGECIFFFIYKCLFGELCDLSLHTPIHFGIRRPIRCKWNGERKQMKTKILCVFAAALSLSLSRKQNCQKSTIPLHMFCFCVLRLRKRAKERIGFSGDMPLWLLRSILSTVYQLNCICVDGMDRARIYWNTQKTKFPNNNRKKREERENKTQY